MSRALTKAEQKLLRFPPTESTWVCGRRKKDADGNITVCDLVLSGSSRECWSCKKPKTAKPKLLWPAYLVACKKAGIEPGTRWPVRAETPEADQQPRRTRRKGS